MMYAKFCNKAGARKGTPGIAVHVVEVKDGQGIKVSEIDGRDTGCPTIEVLINDCWYRLSANEGDWLNLFIMSDTGKTIDKYEAPIVDE